MLCGSPPFRGETALAVALQHLKKQPEPLESLRSDLPPALCRIVHQMLAKDPARRFATARDLLRELRRVQIEHFGNDWPEDLPGWDLLAGETAVDARAATTEKLDKLMKTVAAQRSNRRGRVWLAAGLTGACVLGGALAWCFMVPQSLLAEAKAAPPAIPQQKTVLAQWYYACQLGSDEAAWQSVIKYFPEKRNITLRAQQQLALIYLREGELDRAMVIFEKLANLGNDEAELRAFGLAGECGVLSIREDYAGSNAILGQLLPIRNKLTWCRPMMELVEHAVRRNSSRLGSQTAQEWETWLKDQFPNGG
jgi:serine/threonine-protein kinase